MGHNKKYCYEIESKLETVKILVNIKHAKGNIHRYIKGGGE